MIFPVKLCMSFGDFPASDVWWGLPLRSGYTPNDPPSPGTSPDRRFQRPGGVSPMIWFLAIGQQVGALGNYQFKRNISIFYVDCYPFISYIYIIYMLGVAIHLCNYDVRNSTNPWQWQEGSCAQTWSCVYRSIYQSIDLSLCLSIYLIYLNLVYLIYLIYLIFLFYLYNLFYLLWSGLI